MTNQNFRIEAKEFMELDIGHASSINHAPTYVFYLKKAGLLISQYELKLTDCESKLNEAIEVIRFYGQDIQKRIDVVSGGINETSLAIGPRKALEFLNKISSKEE